MRLRWLLIAVLASSLAPTGFAQSPADRDKEAFFRDKVEPILKRYCLECHSHSSGKARGGLMLDSRSGWEKGGDTGPAVVPGKKDASLLIQAVRRGELKMPPKTKLPDAEIAVLERWVDTGAFDPRSIAPAADSRIDLAKGRKHWAFRPIERPAVPSVRDREWPRGEIDRFLLAKLEAAGVRPVAPADRYAWLRRLSLDLTGLPPSLERIERFLADRTPEAASRVVDELLASRAFGERWGRHWLDLVGYADQIGTANDVFAEHAWRYREYVIDAYAKDKPHDVFIREQIAGDLMPSATAEERASRITAGGFLVLGDLTIVEADKEKLRVDVVDQQVDKIGRAFLGMTLGCARCHDHKFDPIPQRDYYALAGFLNATDSVTRGPWGVWSFPVVVELPETDRDRAIRLLRSEEHRRKLDALKAERERHRTAKAEIAKTLDDKTKKLEDAARALLTKTADERTAAIKRLDSEIQHAEFFAPRKPVAFSVRESSKPADMRVTIRGNPRSLGESVPRGFLEVVSGESSAGVASGSGRLLLADWIASANNPLTARVEVNRIWQKLFGEGLVRSVDYFGLPGDRPSHPELLDYLARRFIDSGWSRRTIIREIVLSRAYGMSSRLANPDGARVDPENRLLWRMNRTRLDAEAIRDGLLAVSGRLIESSGGPSLPLEIVENTGGLGPKEVNPPFFRLARFRPEQEFERSIYLPIIRSGPQAGPSEIRNVFDFTQPAEFAGRRPVTAVPTQALFLMNSKMIKDRSRDLAERILEAAEGDSGRLDRLWLLVYNRPITPPERDDCRAFLDDKPAADAKAKPRPSDVERWSELCRALLSSNEFLMRP